MAILQITVWQPPATAAATAGTLQTNATNEGQRNGRMNCSYCMQHIKKTVTLGPPTKDRSKC